MADFKTIVIIIVLAGLFSVAMIKGGIEMANLNNPNQTIANYPALSSLLTDLNNSLEDSYSNANSSLEAISSSPVTLTTGFPVFDAITGIWKTLIIIPMAIYNLLTDFLFNIFLGSAQNIVLGVIATIVIVTVIFAVWRFVATGQ